MSWIKRNLYFLIGGLAALVLMGLAGFYLFSHYKENSEILVKLNEHYEKLNTLNNQNPHPGNLPKGPDNILAAKQQQEQVRDFIKKTRKFFQGIPPVPATETGKVSSQEFTTALRTTLDRMQHEATNSSLVLPPSPQGYGFSFDAVRNRFTFGTNSLHPLSVQLGEVKAICDVLFRAKINSLDSIRRERVATEDSSGPPSDYLAEKSHTNELAVLSPYELQFRCFTPELAAVLAGFASSPYGLLVRTINIELAPSVTQDILNPVPTPTQIYTPPPQAAASAIPNAAAEADAFRRRYGIGGGRPGEGRYGEGGAAPFIPQPQVAPTVVMPTQPANKGGLPTVIDEKQLKVTVMLHVVKLIPQPEPK